MRVVSLIYSLAGGGGRVATDLIRGFDGCKHKIFHIGEDPQFSTGMSEELQQMGVSVTRVLNDRLDVELEIFKPDIVFYHWWPLPSNTYDPTIINKHAPSILISHYNAPPPDGYKYYVAVSRFGATFMRNINHQKVFVIHNGIDASKYSFKKTAHEGFINGRVSSLEAKKIPLDYPEFVNSFDISDMKNIILGDGPRRAELMAKVDAMDAADKFEFPGRVDNKSVRKLLNSFDVSVYITDTHLEVHSIALIEKALAGVPIIAEPRGGIPEQVIHGRTGFLSHRRDELKEFCETLARDRKLLNKMSNSARIFALKFTIEEMARKYHELIDGVVLK